MINRQLRNASTLVTRNQTSKSTDSKGISFLRRICITNITLIAAAPRTGTMLPTALMTPILDSVRTRIWKKPVSPPATNAGLRSSETETYALGKSEGPRFINSSRKSPATMPGSSGCKTIIPIPRITVRTSMPFSRPIASRRPSLGAVRTRSSTINSKAARKIPMNSALTLHARCRSSSIRAKSAAVPARRARPCPEPFPVHSCSLFTRRQPHRNIPQDVLRMTQSVSKKPGTVCRKYP